MLPAVLELQMSCKSLQYGNTVEDAPNTDTVHLSGPSQPPSKGVHSKPESMELDTIFLTSDTASSVQTVNTPL
jgi:hypothetical protein